jgi:hypothetical protein
MERKLGIIESTFLGKLQARRVGVSAGIRTGYLLSMPEALLLESTCSAVFYEILKFIAVFTRAH